MNKALKGALLSGLVFPGLGQVVLKHYKRGVVIMLTVLVSMVVIVVKAIGLALTILEKLDLEGGAISLTTITDAATQASANSGSPTDNLLLLLIIGCWLISTVDAYLLGKRKDSKQDSPGPG
ncbi:MAG: hypothetical protein ABFQ82_02070 [Thermodesulfobacteriota bacterium]